MDGSRKTTRQANPPTPSESAEMDRSAAYLSGDWITRSEMQIDVADLGFTQAVTAVERLRTYHGRPFQVARHARRFDATVTELVHDFEDGSGAFAEIESSAVPGAGGRGVDGRPYRAALMLRSVVGEILDRNAGIIRRLGDVGVVVFVTPGGGGSSPPTFGAHLVELDSAMIRRRVDAGQGVVITDVEQPSAASWSRSLKTRCRLHYYLADRKARRFDPEATGVLVDCDSTVTESSTANLAIVRNGQITSPPKDRVLGGVTQSVIETAAERIGIPWSYRPVTIAECIEADEILLMGTTCGLWYGNACHVLPVVTSLPALDSNTDVEANACSGQAGLTRGPGPVFQKLRSEFHAIIDRHAERGAGR